MKKNIINFSESSDRRTGFMSSESRHSFIIDEKRWPTVEHYVQAKRFQGTLYEDELRKAPNVFQLHRMVKGRKIRKTDSSGELVGSETVYGKKRYHSRRDWDDVKDDILEEAMQAKFDQNPRLQERLKETGSAMLVDEKDIRTGPILEAIRTEIDISEIPKVQTKKIKLRDIRSFDLTDKDNLVIYKYLEIYNLLKSTKITLEEIVPETLYTSSKLYISEILSTPWSDIYRTMPNYISLYNKVDKYVSTYRPQIYDVSVVTDHISALLMWMKNGLRKEQRDVFLSHVRKVEPRKRVRFGKDVPKKEKGASSKNIKRDKKNILEILRSESGEQAEQLTLRQLKKLHKKRFRRRLVIPKDQLIDYLRDVYAEGEHLEKPKGKRRKGLVPKKPKIPPKAPKLLEVVDKKGPTFEVWGESLKEFAPELLAIGGYYPKKKIRKRTVFDKSKIRFQRMYMEDVQKVMFKALPDQEKYIQAYQKWVQEKILDFVDMAIQLASLKNEQEITGEIIQYAINDIYGCHIELSWDFDLEFDYTPIIKDVLSKSKTYAKYSLTDDAQEMLSQYIERLGAMLVEPVESKKYLLGEENASYELFRERLEDLRTWFDVETEKQADQYGSLDSLQVFILRALSNIMVNMTAFEPTSEYDICIRSFLALLPPGNWRQGAMPYIESVIEDYEDGMDIDELEEILQEQYAIEFKLGDIKTIVVEHEKISDENVNVMCLVIFAAALHYLSPSLRKKQFDWLLRRVKKLADLGVAQLVKEIEV